MTASPHPQVEGSAAHLWIIGTLVLLAGLDGWIAIWGPEGSFTWWLSVLVGFWGASIIAGVVALFKGKWGAMLLGLAAAFVTAGVGTLLWFIPAFRLAKPDSTWARAFYGRRPEKMRLSRERFPPEPTSHPSPSPASARGNPSARRPVHETTNIYFDARTINVYPERSDYVDADVVREEPSTPPALPIGSTDTRCPACGYTSTDAVICRKCGQSLV
jgi:hypothetical protein